MSFNPNIIAEATVSEVEFEKVEKLFQSYGCEFLIKDKGERPELFHLYLYGAFFSETLNKKSITTGWDLAQNCKVYGVDGFLKACESTLKEVSAFNEGRN